MSDTASLPAQRELNIPDGVALDGVSRRTFLAAGAAAAAGVITASRGWALENPGTDDELAWTPAWELKTLFAQKRLSPLEYAQFLLDRVERY